MITTIQVAMLVACGIVSGAPVMEDENMIRVNTTSQCFQDLLQEKLKMQFEMCLHNSTSASNVPPMVQDVFLCALKAEDMVNEEDMIDLMKLKMSAVKKEEDKMEEEKNDLVLKMAVEKCEMDDTRDGKAKDFAECIVGNVGLTCTNATTTEEAMMMEAEA